MQRERSLYWAGNCNGVVTKHTSHYYRFFNISNCLLITCASLHCLLLIHCPKRAILWQIHCWMSAFLRQSTSNNRGSNLTDKKNCDLEVAKQSHQYVARSETQSPEICRNMKQSVLRKMSIYTHGLCLASVIALFKVAKYSYCKYYSFLWSNLF